MTGNAQQAAQQAAQLVMLTPRANLEVVEQHQGANLQKYLSDLQIDTEKLFEYATRNQVQEEQNIAKGAPAQDTAHVPGGAGLPWGDKVNIGNAPQPAGSRSI